jgi:HSP20 family protein
MREFETGPDSAGRQAGESFEGPFDGLWRVVLRQGLAAASATDAATLGNVIAGPRNAATGPRFFTAAGAAITSSRSAAMAEPQVHSDGDKNAARNAATTPTAGKKSGPEAEARTFGETERGQRGQLTTERRAPEAELAETGRQAGRHLAEAWSRSFDPFLAFQMDVNRWFDELWRQTTGLSVHAPMRTGRPLSAFAPAALLGQPAADLRETDKAYELAVELPGLTREDIDVSLDRNALTIRGHKAEQRAEGTGAYRVSERRFGSFERAFPLPDDIDRNAIEATFRDGLLAITLPKNQEAASSRSRIEIR